MENIQRDLAKEIAALQSVKSTRKTRRWTLLFVGDHGKVVTIRWFRWIVTLWAALLILAAVCSGTLYFLYHYTRNENVNLQRSLDNIQHKIAGLQRDKEVLMAQLVLAETQSERPRARTDAKPGEKKESDDRQNGRASIASESHNRVVRPGQAEGAGANEQSRSNALPADSEKQDGSPKVSIEDFNVFHEAASSTFRAQFVLRNAGPDSNPVSGYTAVIFKKPNTPPDKWLTLPTVKLAAGVPTGDRRGQYFSIARFKTVRFMVKSKIDPQQFNLATVYVFETNGNLLLEEDLPLSIQEAVLTPNP